MPVNLTIKYFDFDDLKHLNNWLLARGHKTNEIYDLPSVGFIVSDGDLPIAACFLRRCEGNLGIVDGLCSNPEASSELRHAALDLAISAVCEEAKTREITNLIAWSIDTSALLRGCQRHGFLQTHYTLMTRNLMAPHTN